MTTHEAAGRGTDPIARAAINLDDPIWTVDHVAVCFGVRTDTARGYTRGASFPAPRVLSSARRGGRHLWRREDVLAWFAGLVPIDREGADREATPAGRSAISSGHHEPVLVGASSDVQAAVPADPGGRRKRVQRSRSAAALSRASR